MKMKCVVSFYIKLKKKIVKMQKESLSMFKLPKVLGKDFLLNY